MCVCVYVTMHTLKKKNQTNMYLSTRHLSFDLQMVQLVREDNENIILSDLWLSGVGLGSCTKKEE